LRIGQFTDVYKPVINGVVHYVSLHKRTLESWGHQVYVFTIGNEDYQDDEPNVVRSPALPLSDTGYHLSFRYSRRARRLAETMDVLHCHHPFLAGRQAVRLAQKHNIPLVYTNHTRYDLLAPIYVPFIPESLSSAFLEAYMPHFTSQCDLVIAPSRGTMEMMRQWGVTCPIEIIPNGIDLNRFQKARPYPRAELGLPDPAVVAIHVGRVAAEKNLLFLLRAFVHVAADLPDTYLVLVGDGPERENLEDFTRHSGLQERVRFVGEAPYDEVPSWLAMADFFALTSKGEGGPLTAIEALAAGLPVVAVRASGVEDVVEDGGSGLLSEPTVHSFASCFRRLASDGQLRARLATGALKASENFDIQRTSAILLEHYERLAEQKARERAQI